MQKQKEYTTSPKLTLEEHKEVWAIFKRMTDEETKDILKGLGPRRYRKYSLSIDQKILLKVMCMSYNNKF
jgi:hypothetical protein